jgi:hypothetical protein
MKAGAINAKRSRGSRHIPACFRESLADPVAFRLCPRFFQAGLDHIPG